ncbi:hypothetical protein [Dokdonella sp.]|uniref:hypothetical protein n=1 Tax=Dokdonella sp. TaxID=2291710 RepID=UPI0031C2BF04|nr:hypothetical protein [Dokdonella sp.]
MALKILSALYITFALFGFLVLIAPGNASTMFFWSGSRSAGIAAAAHAWVAWGVLAACGVSAWVAPQHTVTLAWAVVAVAGIGHLLVAFVGRRPICRRCLVGGAVLQSLAAIAVTFAAR